MTSSGLRTQRVRFLHLEHPDARRKDQIICTLADTFCAQGKKILLRTDESRIYVQDEALWLWPPGRFVPHSILPCALDVHPVLLTHQDCDIEGIDIVIVSSPPRDPTWLHRFPYVIDFVEAHDTDKKQQSRERFRRWRSVGIAPEYDKEFSIPWLEALEAAEEAAKAQKQAQRPPEPQRSPEPQRPPERQRPPEPQHPPEPDHPDEPWFPPDFDLSPHPPD